eukprot:scaffold142548_cov13-Tisochrysis_lutea.AAC.2
MQPERPAPHAVPVPLPARPLRAHGACPAPPALRMTALFLCVHPRKARQWVRFVAGAHPEVLQQLEKQC